MDLKTYQAAKERLAQSQAATSFRSICRQCRKVLKTCYCKQIKPFAAGPKFVILLHPKEGRKRLGTGRLTKLCITNAELFEGVDFSQNADVNAIFDDAGNYPVLLYPGANAIDLSKRGAEVLEQQVPAGKQLVIVLLDGSWPCAKKMLKINPRLRKLPQIQFTPPHLSIYQIRRQPMEICFSTIESVHYMIGQLNQSLRWQTAPGRHENLLEVFRYMISQQLSFVTDPNQKATRGYRKPT